MDEFNNRMDAQRKVLSVVNGHGPWREELCGLSANAIDRWIRVNQFEHDWPPATLLKEISKRLLFLAHQGEFMFTVAFAAHRSSIARLIRGISCGWQASCRHVIENHQQLHHSLGARIRIFLATEQ